MNKFNECKSMITEELIQVQKKVNSSKQIVELKDCLEKLNKSFEEKLNKDLLIKRNNTKVQIPGW